MYWLILGSFLLFFLIVGPVLLYWFISWGSRTMMEKRQSFIGFPQDEAEPQSGRDES